MPNQEAPMDLDAVEYQVRSDGWIGVEANVVIDLVGEIRRLRAKVNADCALCGFPVHDTPGRTGVVLHSMCHTDYERKLAQTPG